MKIGLVTIAHGHNYGNRLQNYAIQKIFEKKGHTVETIRHPYYGFEKRTLFSVFLKRITHFKYSRIVRRIWKFTRFNQRYIRFGKRFIQSGDIDRELSNEYDAFLCGSDQVWNPGYFTEKDSYFLSFVEGKKKIALSASFGVETIEEKEEQERIAKRLNELDAISVREKSGVDIVKQLSGRDAELVLDPTMNLTAEEWMKIERKSKGVKDKFILVYLLGHYDKEKFEEIKKKYETENLRVIFLQNEYSKLKIGTDEEFSMDPSEYIWLIRNSEMVITDSFHAVIFSLLFEKNFKIVKRDTIEEDISTRIVNLIELFNIANPYYDEREVIQGADVDYEYVKNILERERKHFNSFIDKNI